MITIRIYQATKNENEMRDFCTSLANHASSSEAYELLDFGEDASHKSRVEITLPNNCLVLGRDWDKYINYALDHDIVIDEDMVKRRLKLVSRPDNGVFVGISIK